MYILFAPVSASFIVALVMGLGDVNPWKRRYPSTLESMEAERHAYL